MKVYTTPVEPPIGVDDPWSSEAVELVTHIEVYYDPHMRLWTAIALQKDGYQVLAAEYDIDRGGAYANMIIAIGHHQVGGCPECKEA